MSRKRLPNPPDPSSWDIEKPAINCSESSPVEVESFTYRREERSQFDMHYCLELGVVLEGSMERHYLTYERACKAGEAWLCGMWEPHGWGVRRPPCRVAVFFLHPPLLAHTHFTQVEGINWMAPFSALPQDRPQVPEARLPEAVALARSALDSPCSTPSARKIALHLKVLEILLILVESWRSAASPRKWSGRELDCLGRAMQLAQQTPGLVTTREAAERCGLNRNALSRLFVEYVGLSFAEFALRNRVSSAAVQLKSSEEPIKAIASQWGFADPSHFHRCFVKYYGRSPADYRGGGRRRHL